MGTSRRREPSARCPPRQQHRPDTPNPPGLAPSAASPAGATPSAPAASSGWQQPTAPARRCGVAPTLATGRPGWWREGTSGQQRGVKAHASRIRSCMTCLSIGAALQDCGVAVMQAHPRTGERGGVCGRRRHVSRRLLCALGVLQAALQRSDPFPGASGRLRPWLEARIQSYPPISACHVRPTARAQRAKGKRCIQRGKPQFTQRYFFELTSQVLVRCPSGRATLGGGFAKRASLSASPDRRAALASRCLDRRSIQSRWSAPATPRCSPPGCWRWWAELF